jgi:hypothetical protein
MCNFHMWAQIDEDVYVLQCAECNTFQVRLRNAAYLFDPCSYFTFCRIVSNSYEKVTAAGANEPVIIPTFNHGLDMLLHYGQLKELYHLVDMADTEMKAIEMSRLFCYDASN